VSNSRGPESNEHPKALLLPYVEDLLEREDRAMVEEHLQECDECAGEVASLGQMIDILRNNKETMCPESWDLHEFVETGRDPRGRIAAHLRQCPLCREELEALRTVPVEDAMPAQLLAGVMERLPASVPAEAKTLISEFFERLASLFRSPAMGLAAVAVAATLAVMLYPRDAIRPVMGLSSVNWAETGGFVPKSDLFGPRKPRVAMILFFKGFEPPIPQDKIDGLYKALKPSVEMKERYEFLTPAAVKKAISDRNISSDEESTVALDLAGALEASRILVFTVTAAEDRYGIEGAAIDGKTGKTIGKTMERETRGNELARKLRESSIYLLNAERKQP